MHLSPPPSFLRNVPSMTQLITAIAQDIVINTPSNNRCSHRCAETYRVRLHSLFGKCARACVCMCARVVCVCMRDLFTYPPEVTPFCEPSRLSNVRGTVGGAPVTSCSNATNVAPTATASVKVSDIPRAQKDLRHRGRDAVLLVPAHRGTFLSIITSNLAPTHASQVYGFAVTDKKFKCEVLLDIVDGVL